MNSKTWITTEDEAVADENVSSTHLSTNQSTRKNIFDLTVKQTSNILYLFVHNIDIKYQRIC